MSHRCGTPSGRGLRNNRGSLFAVERDLCAVQTSPSGWNKEDKMAKIETPEDVVVVSRRELMRLSSLAAAGSVMFGGLALGAAERRFSPDSASPAAGPGESDRLFGG